MPAHGAKCRNTAVPTPLLAPVIAIVFVIAPVAALAGRGPQTGGAPILRPLRVGRRSRVVRLLTVYLQLLHSGRPGAVQFRRIGHPGEHDAIDLAVETQASMFVVLNVPSPELGLARAATEIELAVRSRHAVEI